jgi:hypothetical protein
MAMVGPLDAFSAGRVQLVGDEITARMCLEPWRLLVNIVAAGSRTSAMPLASAERVRNKSNDGANTDFNVVYHATGEGSPAVDTILIASR